jgi:hypothetical protein
MILCRDSRTDPFAPFRYCDDDPVDGSDPTGLELQVQLQRDDFYVAPHQSAETAARLQPSTLRVYDNGKLVLTARANENGFLAGRFSMGVKQGEYKLLPKGDAWGPGGRPETQPSITGHSPGLKPGQPNNSYKQPAEIHEAGATGRGPDSSACVTTAVPVVERIRELMMRDVSKHETSKMTIIDGHEVRRATPVKKGE